MSRFEAVITQMVIDLLENITNSPSAGQVVTGVYQPRGFTVPTGPYSESDEPNSHPCLIFS